MIKDVTSIEKLLDVGIGNAKNIFFAKQYNYECIGIDIFPYGHLAENGGSRIF